MRACMCDTHAELYVCEPLEWLKKAAPSNIIVF